MMRRLHNPEPRTSKSARKEPMAEGIANVGKPFSDGEVMRIIERRDALAAEGKRDWGASRALAREMGRNAGSIDSKIRELIRVGRLGANPNKRGFSDGEVELIIRRRNALAAEGKNDWEISTALAVEMGRSGHSVVQKIERLVEGGTLGENENKVKQKDFSEKELELIIRRREELAAEGKNDGQIGRMLAGEMGRGANSVIIKIRKLVRAGRARENGNKQAQFSDDELKRIIGTRKGLAAEGKTDGAISKVLAREIGRNANSIETKIRQLVGEGRIGENGNKQKDFSEKELELIIRRREELAAEGKNDSQISRVLAGKMERSAHSIEAKIKQMMETGRLGENGNKRKYFSNKEVELIIRRRGELAAGGKNDSQISRLLAGEMGLDAGSVEAKIRNLIGEGRLGKNVNIRHAKPLGFYSEMDDDALVRYAQDYIRKGGIGCRKGLLKADSGLHGTLARRKLLGAVFRQMDRQRHLDAVDGVLDAMGTFGD